MAFVAVFKNIFSRASPTFKYCKLKSEYFNLKIENRKKF